MGDRVERYFLPALIGFAPFLFLLLTWAPEGRTPAQSLIQAFYLPLVGAELFIVIVALREGLAGAMRRWSWAKIPTLALLLLLSIAVATAIVAPNPFAARVWTIFWLLHLAFGFSVAHLCGRALGRHELVRTYLGGFVAFVVGAILFATQVRDPNFNWTHGWPIATHIRHYGYYAAAMIGLCLGLAATERRTSMLWALFLLATAGFAFALWTGSRGTVVGAAGALVAGLVLIPAIRRPIIWIGTVVSIGLGGWLASLFPAPGPWMGVGRTINQTIASADVSTGRTQIWMNALNAIREQPIFGYGENQMATVAPFHGLAQTHSVIFQVLLAWGAVGFVCVTILAVWFLVRAVPAVRHDGKTLAAPFMAMLAIASLALIDGTLFHVLPVSIFAACAGIIASRWRPAGDKPA